MNPLTNPAPPTPPTRTQPQPELCRSHPSQPVDSDKVQHPQLVVVHEGVYRDRSFPADFLSRCVGISAADPRLVICCGGAGQLWEYRRTSKIGLHASSTSTGVSLGDGTLVHRCPVMPPAHVHERADGIRVTSPARTVFDIAKHVGPRTLESVIEQGLKRSQFDIPTLSGIGRLLCRRGRAGSQRFAQVVTSRPAWRRPVDSHPELELLAALSARGVHLRTQVKLVLPGGQTIHPDLGDPEIRFFIEIDDYEWHGGRVESTNDDRRDRRVRLGGGRVERVSTDEIDHMTTELLDELIDAYHQQRSVSLRTR